MPCTVKKDHGRIYIAQNAARHPSSPLEPLFRALFASDPDFAINSIDIISDRNNIRKLLSFIDPSLDSKRLEPFTIKAELINGTAVLCRDETRVQIFVGPKKFVGYGHEFEKAYTTQEIHGSTGHHRIISYCLDNLNFIIRHETDGYADDALTESTRITKENNGLSEMLQDLSLSKGAEKAEHPGSKLAVRKQGRIVPQDSVLEIKTAGQNKRLPFKKAASQLWISQTNKLVRASHKEGTFDVPFVEDVSAEIAKWEENNQEHLRMLVSLIRRIIEVVKSTGDVFIKYDPEGDKLVISKRRGKKMLPRDLYLKMTGTTPRGDNVTLHAKTEVCQVNLAEKCLHIVWH